jgi:hypothetical protein
MPRPRSRAIFFCLAGFNQQTQLFAYRFDGLLRAKVLSQHVHHTDLTDRLHLQMTKFSRCVQDLVPIIETLATKRNIEFIQINGNRATCAGKTGSSSLRLDSDRLTASRRRRCFNPSTPFNAVASGLPLNSDYSWTNLNRLQPLYVAWLAENLTKIVCEISRNALASGLLWITVPYANRWLAPCG